MEEEFSVWEKNTPLLYDPYLTVQWLPSPPQSGGGDLSVHELILGTHTSDDVPNFLMAAHAYLPQDPTSAIEIDPDNSVVPKVEIVQKIHVDGEVNRARCMPQNEAIVTSKTNGTEVYVFDCTKQLLNTRNGCSDPDFKLKGRLSFSPSKVGHLLSGSNDCKICLWDISAMAQDKVLEAKYIYEEMIAS